MTYRAAWYRSTLFQNVLVVGLSTTISRLLSVTCASASNRFHKLRTVRTLLHAVDQLGGKTALLVHNHIRRLLHQPHGSRQTAGRTYGIQIAEAVSHKEHLIGIFDQFLHGKGNGANLGFGLLLDALGGTAEKAEPRFSVFTAA